VVRLATDEDEPRAECHEARHREDQHRAPPVAADRERHGHGGGDRRAEHDAAGVCAGAQRAPAREPVGDDHRGDRAGDADPNADHDRHQDEQGDARHERPHDPGTGDQGEAGRQREPWTHARGERRSDRGEQAHAQDWDGGQQAGDGRAHAEVFAHEGCEWPDLDDLRPQAERGDEQAGEDGDREALDPGLGGHAGIVSGPRRPTCRASCAGAVRQASNRQRVAPPGSAESTP
jgi:hypothetical protein